MLAGRRLLESLIVYCKIDVAESIRNIKTKKGKKGVEELKEGEGDDDEKDEKFYNLFKAEDLEHELT